MSWTKILDAAITSLGGPSALALRFSVSKQAVSYWRKKGVPPKWRDELCDIAGVPRPALPPESGKLPRAFDKPPCFAPEDWKLWRRGGAHWQHAVVHPCHDCTVSYRQRMLAQGRCNKPGDLREPPDQSAPIQVWVEARFVR